MERPHSHDELELNVVTEGRLEYLFGNSRVAIDAGHIALFWAATPHRLVDPQSGEEGTAYWAHIPLDFVIGWGLPDRQLREILTGEMLIWPTEPHSGQVESNFESWLRDIQSDDTRSIALLEIQALVRRLLMRCLEPRQGVAAVPASDGAQRISAMAQFIASNFRRPISVAEVAGVVHLNPNYASGLFRNVVGTTFMGYLSQCRLAEAKRLLVTTSMTTAEVAHAAGFGSQSSFYAHFTRTCGLSPGAYRNEQSQQLDGAVGQDTMVDADARVKELALTPHDQ